MRWAPALAVLLVMTGTTAQAMECVYLNKPNFGTKTSVPTDNGIMVVEYPAGGATLPIRHIKVDGFTVFGGFPGNVPLAFTYADKSGVVRVASTVFMQFVVQANAQPGTAAFYDAQQQPITTGSIGFMPSDKIKVDPYWSPPGVKPARTVITFPRTLIVQFCVEPAESTGVNLRQFMRRHR